MDGTTTMSTHERKASLREFYGMFSHWMNLALKSEANSFRCGPVIDREAVILCGCVTYDFEESANEIMDYEKVWSWFSSQI